MFGNKKTTNNTAPIRMLTVTKTESHLEGKYASLLSCLSIFLYRMYAAIAIKAPNITIATPITTDKPLPGLLTFSPRTIVICLINSANLTIKYQNPLKQCSFVSRQEMFVHWRGSQQVPLTLYVCDFRLYPFFFFVLRCKHDTATDNRDEDSGKTSCYL